MRSFFLHLAILFLVLGVQAQQDPITVIPQPVSMQEGSGAFVLSSQTVIEILEGQTETEALAAYLSNKLSLPAGFSIPVKKVKSFNKGAIQLQLSEKSSPSPEGYNLLVEPASVRITAVAPAGIFYGIQSLIQLMPKEIESKTPVSNIEWKVPAVRIADHPRFGWRGLLFDVSRHFFSKQEVKDFIDNMVKYKFNLLHLHLSDDQGWRVEIKTLPKLTEVGAWRAERKGKWGNTTKPAPDEPKNYGGFFTHEDIRELVAYAKARFVSVLPEIDCPGHSMAMLAAYPELSCTPGTYQVNAGDKFIDWRPGGFVALTDNTLCPANEKVYDYLDKVFTEIAELFPFEYIHMGGDECAKNFWMKSAAVKELMKKEGLANMHEVQSYFVKRVEKILKSKGKKLIGWDEIMDGGLPADATVMSWRGMKGGIKAAKMGHKVVMSPADFAYLDLYQGDPAGEPPTYSMVRLKTSYQFDPVPEGVDEKLILGGQGNLWTEQIHNTRHLNYMLWPRGLAVAESVWSPKEKKDWTGFVQRVEKEFKRMDMAQVKYSRSMYDPIFKFTTEGATVKLAMETEIEGLDIYYSYDGSNPDRYYPRYSDVLQIPDDVSEIRVITYMKNLPAGKQINIAVPRAKKEIKK